MSAIVLATLNAKYPHCAFGLRYLLANMGDLGDDTTLLEFTINQQTLDTLVGRLLGELSAGYGGVMVSLATSSAFTVPWSVKAR